MYFYKYLYAGPSIGDVEETKRKLRCNAGQLTLYVLMLSPGHDPSGGEGQNQIEFCHCINLQQPYYRMNPPYIIGLAGGRAEAVEMVRQIVQETYDHTGSADIWSYLFPHGIRVRKGHPSEDK